MVLQRLVIVEANEEYGTYNLSVSKLDRYRIAGSGNLVFKRAGTISLSVSIN